MIIIKHINIFKALKNTINYIFIMDDNKDIYDKIIELQNIYSNNPLILSKIRNFILTELPNILSTTNENLLQREHRRVNLQENSESFVNLFIQKNKIFYSSTSEIFFNYDNNNFFTIKEDTIIHKILYELRHRNDLIPWKFKIKTSIIKNIKEHSILNAIPESITIQNILDYMSNIFDTKIESKYFLTAIGDIILKKTQLINLISPNAKPIIRLIENLGSQYFGHIPLFNSFKFKYYDHNYNDCRIIVTKNIINKDIIDKLTNNIINIIIISCYYSNRFSCADSYIKICNNSIIQKRILYLLNNNHDSIISNFISNKLEFSSNSNISMKNMIYLWKVYLDEIKVPYIINTNNLKNLLKSKLNYDQEEECFINYTSNQIPIVSQFINFWDTHITDNNNEIYYEIDELILLFKYILNKNIDISESYITNLIKHFYPDINIEGKYIYGIGTNIWNKQEDIKSFLKNKFTNTKDDHISKSNLYNLYIEYTSKYCKKNKSLIIVSKSYFDMYIKLLYNKYDSDDNIIISFDDEIDL